MLDCPALCIPASLVDIGLGAGPMSRDAIATISQHISMCLRV